MSAAGLPAIVAWDCEGVPMFADDELDARYGALIDKMRAHDAETDTKTWFSFDMGVGALVHSDANLDLADEALDIMREMVARARLQRRAVDEALGLESVPGEEAVTATTATVCRDGLEAEPFTPEALAGLRRALRFHDSTGTVPRLVATIDQMIRDRLVETTD